MDTRSCITFDRARLARWCQPFNPRREIPWVSRFAIHRRAAAMSPALAAEVAQDAPIDPPSGAPSMLAFPAGRAPATGNLNQSTPRSRRSSIPARLSSYFIRLQNRVSSKVLGRSTVPVVLELEPCALMLRGKVMAMAQG